MIPSAVHLADKQGSHRSGIPVVPATIVMPLDRCSLPYVQTVVKPLKFPSNPTPANPFIAVTALKKWVNSQQYSDDYKTLIISKGSEMLVEIGNDA